MIFADVPLSQAAGAIAAHSIRLGDLVIKKGVVLTAQHVKGLAALAIDRVTIARLEPDDTDENTAAARLAQSLLGANVMAHGPATGRANLFATADGVLQVDAARIDSMNMVDEALTVATLPNWRVVQRGEMIATVKIIPFAVPSTLLEQSFAAAGVLSPVSVAAFKPLRVGLIATSLPGLKPAVIRKTSDVLAKRLQTGQASLTAEELVGHKSADVAEAIARMGGGVDLLVLFGASAMTDRRDVLPTAIEQAGGSIIHFGLPVDPGNLLLLGQWTRPDGKTIPVIGAPGCARSPKENGFDWVLQRLMAGLKVTREDMMRMGHGGLLMEIVQRGQLRADLGTVE
jgi:molybdenum cofactor cytidylyltransferase